MMVHLFTTDISALDLLFPASDQIVAVIVPAIVLCILLGLSIGMAIILAPDPWMGLPIVVALSCAHLLWLRQWIGP